VCFPPYVITLIVLLSILFFGIAHTTSLPIPFVIFSAFFVLVTAGSREFAHLGLAFGEIPLYVSELTLFAVIVTLIPTLAFHDQVHRKAFPPALLAYFGLGLIALLRGVPHYGLEAVRDSALCYYAICYPLTILLTRRAREFRIFLYVMVGSWAAASIMVFYHYAMGIGRVLHLHDLVRYGSGSQAISTASGAGVAFAAWLSPRRPMGQNLLYALGIAHLLIGLFLIQHRSLFLAFVGVCFLIVVYVADQRRLWVTVLGVTVLVAALSPFLALLDPGQVSSPLARTLERIQSIAAPHSDRSSEWRLFAWEQAIRAGLENPLFGVGFGRPLILHWQYRTDYNIDPHNSYAALFYRLGLSGVIAFFVLWASTIIASYKAARRHPSRRFRIAFALSSHFGVAIFAMFNVALEGPYMGIPFWCSLGLLRQSIDNEGDWPSSGIPLP
jgi:O-antigen ligase